MEFVYLLPCNTLNLDKKLSITSEKTSAPTFKCKHPALMAALLVECRK